MAQASPGSASCYLDLKCLGSLAVDLRERGVVTKMSRRRDGSVRGSIAFTRGPLGYLLRNRVYVGEIVHKGRHYAGEHEPIVPKDLFEAVATELAAKAPSSTRRINLGSPLAGLIYDDRGNRMTPSVTTKGGMRYRYVSSALLHGRAGEAGTVPRVPAPDLEAAVVKVLAGEGGAPPAETADDRISRPDEADRIAREVARVTVSDGTIEIVRRSDQDATEVAPIACRGLRRQASRGARSSAPLTGQQGGRSGPRTVHGCWRASPKAGGGWTSLWAGRSRIRMSLPRARAAASVMSA
jgi:hypothetical protein